MQQMRRKIIVALLSLIASKHSIAASTLTGIVGGYVATTLGFDPWTWMLGAFGGVIIRAKLPPSSRPDGLINGSISVMLGGLVAPWLSLALATTWGHQLAPNVYVTAFILASAWPWMIASIRNKSGDIIDGVLKKWGIK